MKKSVINGLLVVCALGLVAACFYSIYSDIAFDEEKAALNDMEAVVDHAGDLAFETDHFSTYVIVNNKKEPYAIIKIHHVKRKKTVRITSI